MATPLVDILQVCTEKKQSHYEDKVDFNASQYNKRNSALLVCGLDVNVENKRCET